MTVDEVMAELEAFGNEQTVKTYRNHGADGPMFGVKISDLKTILKRIKGNQQLALDLWETNNSDAMYLAALVADGTAMTKTVLNRWAKTAWWYMLSEYAVPFAAAMHPDACAISQKWMKSRAENVASSGWATYSMVMATRPDDQLDHEEIGELMVTAEEKVHTAKNRVRGAMNQFIISVGTYVPDLLDDAKAAAERIGKVHVDVGNTSCKVPLATDYIAKVETMGRVGRKRKNTKC